MKNNLLLSIVLWTFLGVFPLTLKCQNLIKNGGFEALTSFNCEEGCYLIFTCDNYITKFCRNEGDCSQEASNIPFKANLINDWKCGFGTPQIEQSGCTTQDVHSGSVAAFLGSSSSHKEGIYQDINLSSVNNYNFTFWVKASGNPTLNILLANGLVPNDAQPNINFQNQVVYSTSNISNSWIKIVLSLTPNSNYSQILFYLTGNDGSVLIDDISITQSCCSDHAIYQDIANPPSVMVTNTIWCGNNITGYYPPGDVVISWGANIVFQAGNYILLESGFLATDATFFAFTEDCSNYTLKSSAAYWFEGNCDFVIGVFSCFGSGEYSVVWGDEVTGAFRKIHPSTETTYTYTVTDINTGAHVSGTITVPPFPAFFGAATAYIPNSFSPNNDGINDVWQITDNGKSFYAYNAYAYELRVFDESYGQLIYRSNRIGHKGFSDTEIKWNGAGLTGEDVLYYTLELENCSGITTFNGTVTAYAGSSFKSDDNNPFGKPVYGDASQAVLTNTDFKNTEYIQFINKEAHLKQRELLNTTLNIFPNPAATETTVTLSLESTARGSLQLLDIHGRQVNNIISGMFVGQRLYHIPIPLASIPEGIYYVILNTDLGVRTQKLIVLK